jgi:hypothetical protein
VVRNLADIGTTDCSHAFDKDLLPHLDKGDLLITLMLATATSKTTGGRSRNLTAKGTFKHFGNGIREAFRFGRVSKRRNTALLPAVIYGSYGANRRKSHEGEAVSNRA